MKYTNIRSPKWADSEKTRINVILDTPQYKNIPCTISPEDGLYKEIYADVLAGKHGDIEEYIETEEQKVAKEVQTLTLKIRSLESEITPRRLREAVLTDQGRAFVEDIDRDIAKLRKLIKEAKGEG